MSVKRSALGVAGILAAVLMATFGAVPAYAAAPSAPYPAAGHVLKAPAAPRDALSAYATTTVSPSISPSVSTGHIAPNGKYYCPTGDLCTLVWDYTTSNWKIFYLYKCNVYSVYNWLGNGYYYDAQTGNVTSSFYDDWFIVWLSFQPDYKQHSYDWDPIWYVENC